MKTTKPAEMAGYCGENRRFILNTHERVKPLTLCNSTYFFSVFYFLYSKNL